MYEKQSDIRWIRAGKRNLVNSKLFQLVTQRTEGDAQQFGGSGLVLVGARQGVANRHLFDARDKVIQAFIGIRAGRRGYPGVV
jgi:hypothetical protein